MPYQFSTNLRRRYEQLDRFPEGFLVYGDALCSFDPVYGQGMTVACAESLALRDSLAAGTRGIARRFFKAANHLIDSPWQVAVGSVAVGSDLQHPRVEGKRTAQVRFINWYIAKFFQAAHRDAVLATKFLEVANLVQQPAALLDPRIAMRVWSGNRAPAQAVTKSALRI
jgi:2-polyprenyl-6-methoxyphenol hydroxylase-like FAD-dependent oxidoreductase